MAKEMKERIGIQDGRRPGWHWADNEIIDTYGAQMGPYGLSMYYALCRHANQKGQSWPSYATLAKETGMSLRQAIYAMKLLVELELLRKEPQRDDAGDPTSNMYTLLEAGGGSAPDALGVVQDVHEGSAPRAPKQEPPNKNHSNNNDDDLMTKIETLKAFGLQDPLLGEIAKEQTIEWISRAMKKVNTPGGIVHLHRGGWKPGDKKTRRKEPYASVEYLREFKPQGPLVEAMAEESADE